MSGRDEPGLRCARCGEIIGVYEPMNMILHGVELRTSRLALGDGPAGASYFHAGCVLSGEDGDPGDAEGV